MWYSRLYAAVWILFGLCFVSIIAFFVVGLLVVPCDAAGSASGMVCGWGLTTSAMIGFVLLIVLAFMTPESSDWDGFY